MNALRRRMAVEPERLDGLIRPLLAEFTLHTDSYRRMAVPENLPESLRALYPSKGFYFEKELNDFSLLKSAALADEIAGGFRRFAPLYRYFDELTPEEDADPTIDRR